MPYFCCGFQVKFKDDAKYIENILKHFNSVFGLINNNWNGPDNYNFDQLNYLFDWSKTNKIPVRLGGVICPWLVPTWLKGGYSTAEIKSILFRYIEIILTKFPCLSYDLLLEVFNYDGNLTGNFWHETLGDNYAIEILEHASKFKGNTKMVLSDFGIKKVEKWDGIIQFLKDLKHTNLIDAVSIQIQVNVIPGFFPNTLTSRIQQIQDLGYEVHLPEIVCWENIYFPGGQPLQGKIYSEIINICIQQKIPLYGLISPFDAYPWLHAPYNTSPGVFDKAYKPKPFTTKLFGLIKPTDSNTQ